MKITGGHQALHAFDLSDALVAAQQVLGGLLVHHLVEAPLLRRDTLLQADFIDTLHLRESKMVDFEMVIDVKVQLIGIQAVSSIACHMLVATMVVFMECIFWVGGREGQ